MPQLKDSAPKSAQASASQIVDEMAEIGKEPDIFLWANQADAHKDNLKIDLFFFTKGFTVYEADHDKEIRALSKVIFLYDMISQVQTGAATGMSVRSFEDSENDDNTIEYTQLDEVMHAQEVIEQIQYGEESIEIFHGGDHDFSKVRGIVARFSSDNMEPFYIVKHLPKSSVMKGKTVWAFSGNGKFHQTQEAASVKMPVSNETLIIGSRIFVFNESKFVKQFGYDARTNAVLRNKIEAIEKNFKLRYPEGVSLFDIATNSPSVGKLIIKADPGATTQERVIEQSDEFDIALMTDDEAGVIIISDYKDATKFVNLLNDNYVESGMTSTRYLATAKKPITPTEDSQIGMGI